MRYLNPLRYIHYHTQLAIPTIYDDSLSFYEIMNKTNLHFNEVINDMNENYEIIDKAFQEVLEQTNKWMEEAKAQADRAEQEANKSQASAEASQQAAEDARNQANRAASEADRAKNEADNSAASAVEAQKQADRASSEADRAHTEAENAKSQAEAAANSAQESASSAAASADSASESAASATASAASATASAASATESKNSADASAASATESKNSADASAASATASQNSAVASANSASQAAQSATDAANSAKEAADTLDEAKETFVKKAGDTMSGKLTISYGGLSVDGSAGVTGDFNTGRLQVGTPSEKGNSYLYGDLDLNGILTMSLGGNSALAFSDLTEGLKLYAPLKFVGSPQNISNVANPQEALDAVNKQTLDSSVTSINSSLSQVNEKITSLTSRMDTAESNIAKNTSDITSLTSRVSTNETSINNINTEITNIKQDITTVEGDYVKKAGDTMTGNLNMGLNQIVMDTWHIAAGNDTLLFEAYSEIDMDNARVSMVGTPVDILDAANKEYVDNTVAGVSPAGKYLPLSGGTMSGDINMGVNNSVRFGAANYALYQNEGTGHLVLTGNSNTDIVEMNNIGTVQFGNATTIQNVKTPTNNGDATPKSYVDGQITVAKNDVQEQMQGYLPLTGGRLSGNLLMGTGSQIVFEEGAHLAYATDFGFGVQTNGGSVGIVSNNIVHTDSPTNLDSKSITYSINDVSVVPGTTVKQYNCDGTGFQQMRFSGFQNVKFASSLLVDEDPSEAMQVATKQYVDQHAGDGEQTYYDASAQMVFKIKLLHETTGLYTCDCYYIANSTKQINISSGKMSGFMEVPHTLSSFLNENGYTFEGSNINFVSFASHSSGFCSNQLCSLGEEYVTLWCTSPTPVSSLIEIPFNLNNGFLCSAILRK